MKQLGIFLALLLTANFAQAANTSVYTNFDIKKCKVLSAAVPEEENGGSYICPGYKNLKMYFAEGDLRQLVAFGKNPEKHCASQQTFPQFNSVNSTIEWRLNNGKPIATIQRWGVSDPVDSSRIKNWLVVTKLEASNSCHMAIVEGAFPNANTKAREIADSLATTFKCSSSRAQIVSLPSTNKDESGTSGTCEKN